MSEKENIEVVNNFISSMDMNLPITDHFKNCLKDAKDYKWDFCVVSEIYEKIQEKYENIQVAR